MVKVLMTLFKDCERGKVIMKKEVTVPSLEILFILNYKCTCGRKFKIPSPKLMYEYNRQRSRISRKGYSFEGLPREVRQIDAGELESCDSCFRLKTSNQFDLEFEKDKNKNKNKNKNKIIATPLSAF